MSSGRSEHDKSARHERRQATDKWNPSPKDICLDPTTARSFVCDNCWRRFQRLPERWFAMAVIGPDRGQTVRAYFLTVLLCALRGS